MARARGARYLLLGVASAVLLAVGVGLYATRDTPSPGAAVVAESTGATGWKTIEYEGVRVDIPSDWAWLDSDDCEFKFERWGPPGSPECNGGAAVAFYGSATFDPARRPGVRRSDASEDPDWGGYVTVGELAVYATDDDRDVVQGILASAEAV